jgi:hypothetical protein
MEKALAFTQFSINEAGREIPLQPIPFSVNNQSGCANASNGFQFR